MVPRAGRRRKPPLRNCADCGAGFYRWSGIYCGDCFRRIVATRSQLETWRDFRKRVIERG